MMIYRTLKPSELEAWYAHCHSVFTGDEDGYFRQHYEGDPHADPDMIFVAMDGERIASTVRVFCREVLLHGRAVPMGGIGEVSTKAAYRRQGLAGTLLEMSIVQMEARGMPVSILFGSQPMYERMGWRARAERMTNVEAAALPALPEGVAVRPYAPEDLDAVMGMYALFAGRLDGAVLRGEPYWRQWVLPQWRAPSVLLVEGRPAAYCCAHPGKDGVTLVAEELCAAPQAEALLPGYLRALAETEGLARVRFHTPLIPHITGTQPDALRDMMVRLNLPVEGLDSSGALAEAMENAGMFAVDHF